MSGEIVKFDLEPMVGEMLDCAIAGSNWIWSDLINAALKIGIPELMRQHFNIEDDEDEAP